MRLSVIIPSRAQPDQARFLTRAVAAIRKQTVIDAFDVTILVGIDQGNIPDGDLGNALGLTFAESHTKSQAAALNAAIMRVDTQYVAFLEDDDQWDPLYLQTVMEALSEGAAFVSSTQMEYDENDVFLRINDFATPSGWCMPSSTLRAIGPFDESYRFHLDNEWLGRLGESNLARVHLVESTTPIKAELIQPIRPWLYNYMCYSGATSRLMRHRSPYPLVRRLIHSRSGMAQISSNPEIARVSETEYAQLRQKFGRVPW